MSVEESSVGQSDTDELLLKWKQRISTSGKNWKEDLERIAENRKLAWGYQKSEMGGVPKNKVRANLIHSTNQGVLPLIYARNPDVQVRPSQRVGSQGVLYENTKKFSETLELIINYYIANAELKRQHKRVIRSIQTSRIGWLKVTYQSDYQTDALVVDRINDVQDNLQRLQGKLDNMAELDDDPEVIERKIEEATDIVESLREQVEILEAEGIVIDFYRVEDIRIDEGMQDLLDYKASDWIACRNWYPVEKYQELFTPTEEQMKGVKIYKDKDADDGVAWSGSGSEDKMPTGLVAVWEVWSKVTRTRYTFADGAAHWAREPFVPARLGERWYPFFMLGLHWVDGHTWPLSDVENLERLADEYNETASQQTEHRKANVPHYIASSDADPKDIKSFTIAGAREVVILDTQGRPLKDVIAPSPSIPIDHRMYDRQPIRSEIEWISGLQDAARGGVAKPKTLGEAEIIETHLANRTGNFQDESEEFLTEIAVYIGQLVLLNLHFETVQRIAGPHAFWPKFNTEEAFSLFDVEIRAGSTGKPDKRREQQQWREILPLVIQLIDKILAMRQGQVDPQTGSVLAPPIPDEENPYVRMLEETLKRFDERMDIEQILVPPPAPVAPANFGGGNIVDFNSFTGA